ncbi:MAG: hypothetical protein GC203_11020 [Phenylobacterium sp.]|uniref:hypothetical protein n=1 Tax=Phenylobacterium sp. TaxID=1871053 RepID=UPI0025F85C52|nr:hypothetical protein [Phenylobacterium sp.]MBI1198383.1 hypothetical protein [Phenylobacterium sp.]
MSIGFISYLDEATGAVIAVSSSHPLPVTGGGSGSGASQGAVTTSAPAYTDGTNDDLSLDTHGGLRTVVQASDGTPVDWSAPVEITGRGSAGTADTGVVTVQGITGGTAVPVSNPSAGSFQAQVQGPVADDAAASGNPVPVGGKHNATLPTYADGDRTQWQATSRGSLIVEGPTASAAAAVARPIPIAGVYYSSPATLTDGWGSYATLDSKGNLNAKMNVNAAAGSDTQSNTMGFVVRSDTPTSTLLLGVGPSLYNGSTWSRQAQIGATFGSNVGVAAVAQAGASFRHVTTNTSTDVKTSAGILHKVVINTAGASSNTLTLYNDTTGGTSNAIAVIDTTSGIDTLAYDLHFGNGLQAVTATGTAADITIVYR